MESAKKIMVVDDETDLCEILTFNLENEGYDITVAHSGEEALSKATPEHDLILLDVMMDGISGYKTAEKMRKELSLTTPIIFLTAKVTENDMLTGFSLGADDYITKPFSLKEVLARVKAVLKRGELAKAAVVVEVEPTKEPADVSIDGFDINRENMTVELDAESITLTKKEYDILLLLVDAPERTFSREDILRQVWRDESYVLERTVDVHITRLRKKLGRFAAHLTNRSGYGYSFKINP